MRNPPQLWTWMCTHWCPLPSRLSWVLWRALSQAQWSAAVQWREQFLAFDKPDRTVSSDLVETFLEEVASPQQIMKVLGELMEEKRLLRRDAHQLEEEVLRHVDHTGQWKHHARRSVACMNRVPS